jgi:regulator of replication initiation timing
MKIEEGRKYRLAAEIVSYLHEQLKQTELTLKHAQEENTILVTENRKLKKEIEELAKRKLREPLDTGVHHYGCKCGGGVKDERCQ